MANSAIQQKIQQAYTAAPMGNKFGETLKAALQHFSAEMGTIHFLNPKDGNLHLIASSAGIPEGMMTAIKKIPPGKGIAGEAAQKKKPVTLCNLQKDTTLNANQAKPSGAQAALCVPMLSGEQVLGTFGIGSNKDRVFTDLETAELLEAGKVLAEQLKGYVFSEAGAPEMTKR